MPAEIGQNPRILPADKSKEALDAPLLGELRRRSGHELPSGEAQQIDARRDRRDEFPPGVGAQTADRLEGVSGVAPPARIRSPRQSEKCCARPATDNRDRPPGSAPKALRAASRRLDSKRCWWLRIRLSAKARLRFCPARQWPTGAIRAACRSGPSLRKWQVLPAGDRNSLAPARSAEIISAGSAAGWTATTSGVSSPPPHIRHPLRGGFRCAGEFGEKNIRLFAFHRIGNFERHSRRGNFENLGCSSRCDGARDLGRQFRRIQHEPDFQAKVRPARISRGKGGKESNAIQCHREPSSDLISIICGSRWQD